MKDDLTQDALKASLSYSPETGDFVWICSSHKRLNGKIAGCVRTDGYKVVKVGTRLWQQHRLAFLYMTGSFPPDQVDHINGNPSDNRWSNLRQASDSTNRKNQRLPSHNTSGVMGVSWCKPRKTWRAEIMVNKKTKHLGHFDNIHDAAMARHEAEKELGFHPNHGRK